MGKREWNGSEEKASLGSRRKKEGNSKRRTFKTIKGGTRASTSKKTSTEPVRNRKKRREGEQKCAGRGRVKRKGDANGTASGRVGKTWGNRETEAQGRERDRS